MACSGSNGSARPRACAVVGMNWAIPSAPARLTTPGRKVLSRQITRVMKSTGRWAACAERSIVRHTAWSSDSMTPGAAWQGSAVPPHKTPTITVQCARNFIACGLGGSPSGRERGRTHRDPQRAHCPALLSRYAAAVLIFSQSVQYPVRHLAAIWEERYGRSPRRFDYRRARQGRRVRESLQAAVPGIAEGSRLPALRDLPKRPQPRQIRPVGTVGQPGSARQPRQTAGGPPGLARGAAPRRRRARGLRIQADALIFRRNIPVAGLVPATHVFASVRYGAQKIWMPGTSPRKGILVNPRRHIRR